VVVDREGGGSPQGAEEQQRERRGDEAAHPSGRIPRVPGLQRARPDEGIEVVRLDRPERRNALDSATLAELIDVLDELAADYALRVLVLSTTSERAFCAGADVAEELDREGGIARMEAFGRVYAALEAFPLPTIAVCVGNCVGAGAELAAGSDLRVGGDNLKLAWAGAKLGVPVGPARLVPLVGLSRAKELIYTGRVVGMEEADALGLLARTAPAAQAEDVALELARDLATRPPAGLRVLKRMFRDFEDTAERVAGENLILDAFQREGAGLPQSGR
jgi:enoyl-CoA hydratase/carnithine racemase